MISSCAVSSSTTRMRSASAEWLLGARRGGLPTACGEPRPDFDPLLSIMTFPVLEPRNARISEAPLPCPNANGDRRSGHARHAPFGPQRQFRDPVESMSTGRRQARGARHARDATRHRSRPHESGRPARDSSQASRCSRWTARCRWRHEGVDVPVVGYHCVAFHLSISSWEVKVRRPSSSSTLTWVR